MDFYVKYKQIRWPREQTRGCQERESKEGLGWELGNNRCKILYLGWINNKIPLYSTGNYIQYPIRNHNGKEYEKEKKL